MKKNNLLTLLGIAFVAAILATGAFYGLFVDRLASSTGSGKSLVVAAKPLKAGTAIAPGDLKLIAWNGGALPRGTYGALKDVEGKVLLDSVGDAEPMLASRLAAADGAGGNGVPAGMRAVSVHVTDSTGVMELLRSGTRVDVQVVRRRVDGPTEVRTALLNLKVLAIKPTFEQSSQGHNLPVVTLLATPAEADMLAAADAGARVRLSLRNPLDEEQKRRTMVTLDAVMRSQAPLQ